MRLPRIGKPILLVLPALLFTLALPAQEFRGRIQGTVVDSSGGTVPGATVTLLNTGTAVSATRQTNETGQYIFDLISPGTYTVTAEMAGFTKVQQKGITLQQRGDLSINMVLKPGDIKETVTVSAEASMVQFSNAKLETTVDSKLTNNMPQIYRTPFLLAQLDPAVEKNDAGTEFQPYSSWGANNQRVGGGATLQQRHSGGRGGGGHWLQDGLQSFARHGAGSERAAERGGRRIRQQFGLEHQRDD